VLLQDLIVEHFVPFGGAYIDGDDKAGSFINLVDKIEKRDRNAFFYREDHNVIQDDQVRFQQPFVFGHCRAGHFLELQESGTGSAERKTPLPCCRRGCACCIRQNPPDCPTISH